MANIKRKSANAATDSVEVVERLSPLSVTDLAPASRDKRADKARALLSASMNLFESRH